MIFVSVSPTNGMVNCAVEVFSPVECPDGMIQFAECGDVHKCTKYAFDKESDKFYFVGDPPSPFHVFDGDEWVIDDIIARESKKRELDKIFRNLSTDPLPVNEILIDTDSLSQKNIYDKIQEVRERVRLNIPMQQDFLVWKGANNQVYAFQDLQSYLDWLSVSVIAISERNTRLYVAAWQHKTNIDALTGDAILAYDVTQGWPA